MSVMYDTAGNSIGIDNPLPVKNQSHLTTTIQTHNAVSIPLSSNSISSSWISSDGFNNICVSVLNDNNTTNLTVSIQWSFDGATLQGANVMLANSPANAWGYTISSAILDVKAPYFKIVLVNGDSALAHTMSAWVYLKA